MKSEVFGASIEVVMIPVKYFWLALGGTVAFSAAAVGGLALGQHGRLLCGCRGWAGRCSRGRLCRLGSACRRQRACHCFGRCLHARFRSAAYWARCLMAGFRSSAGRCKGRKMWLAAFRPAEQLRN